MEAPNVTLVLEGMILLFFEEADFTVGKAKSCQVGILRNAPGHIYEISVLKIGDNPKPAVYEEEDIRFTLALKVDNTTHTPIEFKDWDKDFNRLKGTNSKDSFNWVLDVEREIYPTKADGIGANRKQFRSVLRLNTGTFFTAFNEETGASGISLNDLLICDEHDNPKKFIGKVATRVGVNITLDADDSKAAFFNGKEVLFEAGIDDKYLVTVNRIRLPDMEGVAHHGTDATHAASDHNRDANYFYNAIGQELASTEKVFFVSTASEELPPAGPEAACLVAMMSLSEI